MGLNYNLLITVLYQTEHTKCGIILLLLVIIILSPNELYSELVAYIGSLHLKVKEKRGELKLTH